LIRRHDGRHSARLKISDALTGAMQQFAIFERSHEFPTPTRDIAHAHRGILGSE
jgi:hypothetical protein